MAIVRDQVPGRVPRRGRPRVLVALATVTALLACWSVSPAAAASVPSAPRSLLVQTGNGVATLRWSPASANWSAITAYVVTPVTGGVELPAVTVGGTTTSAVVSGLSNGTSYAFRVAARNGVGVGPAVVSDPVVVGVPGAPPFPGAVSGNGSAKVSWWSAAANGSPVTGYVVTPVLGSTELAPRVFSSAATSQVVSGLANGSSYRFKVAAVNALGTGPAASTTAIVVGLPGAPTKLTAQSGNGSATVRWSAAPSNGSAISSYVVTPVAGGADLAPVTVAGTTTSVVVSGLANGTSYVFRVVAVNSAGAGAAVLSASVVVGLPGGPPFAGAVPGNGSAKVSWWSAAANGSPVTGYVVTPVLGSTALAPRVFASAATSQVVSGLVNGSSYRFKIAAMNAVGTGPPSTTAAIIVGQAGAPTKVTASLGTPGTGRVDLSWTAASGSWPTVTAYRVVPVRDGVAQAPVTTTGAETTTTITGLAAGSTYVFIVSAVNAAGLGATSAPSNAVTPLVVLPGPPTALDAVAGSGRAFLTWSAPPTGDGPSITGYVITPHVGSTVLPAITTSDPATSAVVGDLDDGSEYTFTVAATNVHGTGPDGVPSPAITPVSAPDPATRGSIDILGDSITAQSYWSRDAAFAAQGQPLGTDAVKVAGMGFRVPDVRAGEHARAWEVGRPTVMVVALGTNDASPDNGGWTSADELEYRLLLDTPSVETCAVVVLPGYGAGISPERQAEEDLARSAMVRMAAERPGTIVVDWGAVVAVHPEYLGPDGFHLAASNALPGQLADAEAADAFAATIWSGVRSCPADALAGPVGPGFAGLADPVGVALDGEGGTLVADRANDRIERLGPDGVQSTLPFVGLSGPGGVAVDGDGNVLVADTNNDRIVRLATDGTQVTLGFTGLYRPVGLAVDAAGGVLVADVGNGRVVRLSADGHQEVLAFTGLVAPVGVAVDPAGTVTVADFLGAALVQLTAEEVQRTVPVAGLVAPLGVAVAPDGTLAASDSSGHRVVIVDALGGQVSTDLGGATTPAGLVFDGTGRLLVADRANNRILTLGG